MNPSEIEALLARTLLGDYDGEDAWAAVHALRLEGSREAFERAASWCTLDDPLKRARAVDVLCQLQQGGVRVFCDESYSIITTMLSRESNPSVISSAIDGLGHIGDVRAVPVILNHLRHSDDDVRLAVAFALGCFPNDPQSVGGLLQLTSDGDADVRDWAVFGLGVQGDVDSPEIREALLRCLDDESEDVREEAAVGLGKRQELRLLPKLLAMLDECDVKIRVAEAASGLLGLAKNPPDWEAADYRTALVSKFQISG